MSTFGHFNCVKNLIKCGYKLLLVVISIAEIMHNSNESYRYKGKAKLNFNKNALIELWFGNKSSVNKKV